jgi:homoprotocatechuate degradation regulator HpaR
MLLLRARESVMRYFRPNLKRHGLTDQKWRVMRALDERGELEVGRLAELCSIPGPSLSGVLDRMERDELLQRFRISTDHRKVVVDLTPKGRRLVEKLLEPVEAQYARIDSEIGHDELGRLYALLDRVIALPDPQEPRVVRTPLRASRVSRRAAASPAAARDA